MSIIPQVYAAETTWKSPCISTDGIATIKGVECLFQNIISPIPALLALIAIGVIIMAGIRIITSGSDSKALEAAWKALSWAVIGLILLSVAWLVLVLIKNFTGADVTTFTIPSPGTP